MPNLVSALVAVLAATAVPVAAGAPVDALDAVVALICALDATHPRARHGRRAHLGGVHGSRALAGALATASSLDVVGVLILAASAMLPCLALFV
jgi:hypothetical protein